MTKKFKKIALEKLLPGSWYLNDDGKHIFLVDTNISEEDVIAKTVEVQYHYEIKEYQRKRKAEYPDYADYIDGVVKGDQAQIDAYIAACQAVKDKYPKVEVDETELASRKAQALFDYQLKEYVEAQTRLSQYQVALGREEQTEEVVVGQEWNEETEQFDDITETRVVSSAIEPVEATIERTVYSDDMDIASTIETIENPLITKDNEERAAAQAIVDATPHEVIDAYNAL